jgi:exo-beta-1,3-glucanase (GH17 family)
VIGSNNQSTVAHAVAAFALSALAIGIAWWRLGAPVVVPAAPLAQGEKLYCVSYAPYRGRQDPLVEGTTVSAAQIDRDLALIAKYSKCVRTYSLDDGTEAVLDAARRHGLKVLEGIWLSGDAQKNRLQLDTGVALAKRFPDVVSAVIVGNEVLLRGDMTVADLAAAIREVKAQVPEPVSYGEVWEFWLRYREVASAVDFITVHILPYWEDFPVPADRAAAHVEAIRARMTAAFPNKDIVVGEFGWPSGGRMREGALPSRSNQALAIDATLALAKRKNFRVNIIEAFDQPWKRWLEGTVGGQWGIFDRGTGAPKFAFSGGPISDHPHWPMQAFAGIVLAAAMFGGALFSSRGKPLPSAFFWRIAALAAVCGVMFGWTIENVALGSFSIGGWVRSICLAAIAAAAPIVSAAACAAQRPLPAFSDLLCGDGKRRDGLDFALGAVSLVLVVLSLQAALGLVFAPRYRDIPFAPLCSAVVAFLVVRFFTRRRAGPRAVAERVAAWTLTASAVYIVFNETFANWQAVWFCADVFGLAFILASVRDAPG